MLGLAAGLAFLSGFGLGATALIVWAGLGMMALARRGLAVGALAAILLAAVLGVWTAHTATSRATGNAMTGAFQGGLIVEDGPFLTKNGLRFSVRSLREPDLLLCAYAGAEPRPFVNDRLVATGIITSMEDLSDIGMAAVSVRGCDAQLRVKTLHIVTRGTGLLALVSRARVALSDVLMQASPGDAGALLSGLVTGDDGALSERATRAFLSTGTTHITAISGANFATITLLLGVIATGSMRRNIVFVAAACGIIWLYALMVGLEPSALRAALLATAVLIGRRIGRRADLLTLTILLAAIQIAFRPRDFSTLGFQLSVAATIALIIVFDGIERQGNWAWWTQLTATVVAAQLATIPILAWTLGTVSGVGLLANLFAGPIAGLAFPIALVGALLMQVVPSVGEAALLPALALCRALLELVEWSDRALPGTIQLGEPTRMGTVILTFSCWAAIGWFSGDIRRMARHGAAIVRSW